MRLAVVQVKMRLYAEKGDDPDLFNIVEGHKALAIAGRTNGYIRFYSDSKSLLYTDDLIHIDLLDEDGRPYTIQKIWTKDRTRYWTWNQLVTNAEAFEAETLGIWQRARAANQAKAEQDWKVLKEFLIAETTNWLKRMAAVIVAWQVVAKGFAALAVAAQKILEAGEKLVDKAELLRQRRRERLARQEAERRQQAERAAEERDAALRRAQQQERGYDAAPESNEREPGWFQAWQDQRQAQSRTRELLNEAKKNEAGWRSALDREKSLRNYLRQLEAERK